MSDAPNSSALLFFVKYGKWISAALLLFSSLFSFIFAEAYLRHYCASHPKILSPFLYNREIPHPYGGQRVAIDFFRSLTKSPGEYVIVVSGGSTAFGSGAPVERNICAMLEKYLNEKNRSKRVSNFKVINAANPSYHTGQEKNVLDEMFFLESKADMFVCIDGFNNLARPLENHAYGLPLNFPGYPWIIEHGYQPGPSSLLRLGQFLELIRDNDAFRKTIFKSRLLFVAINVSITRVYMKYYDELFQDMNARISVIPDAEKIKVFNDSLRFYQEDIIEMDALAGKKGVFPIFVLQPLLGLDKKSPTGWEKSVIEKKTASVHDLTNASYGLYVQGHRQLQEAGKRLGQDHGINFIDFTAIFKDTTEGTHVDLMHMNAQGQGLFADRLANIILGYIMK